jgi:hypothetical protein
VEQGWVLILDDDNMLSSTLSLRFLAGLLTDSARLVVWRYFRPDKIVFPAETRRGSSSFVHPQPGRIAFGEIDSSSFIFHRSLAEGVAFRTQRGGDYLFFRDLLAVHAPTVLVSDQVCVCVCVCV